MNCKPGDLAIVVRSAAGNLGKVVRCIRLATEAEKHELCFFQREAMWFTDTPMTSTWGCVDTLMFDAYLRPIRDSDGEDEMLRIVGKPETVGV